MIVHTTLMPMLFSAKPVRLQSQGKAASEGLFIFAEPVKATIHFTKGETSATV
jgi:hypothetical protein